MESLSDLLRADIKSVCVLPMRASALSAFQQTAGLARTKRVRAAARACPQSRQVPGGPSQGTSFPDVQLPHLRARVGAGCARAQLAPGFAGFLDLCGLTLTGFRSVAGLRLSGLPALTDVTSDDLSGSDRKYTRQPGESWALFLTMQTVTRSTSGISALQRRNASSLHACCSSGV